MKLCSNIGTIITDGVWLDYIYAFLPYLLLQRSFALLFPHMIFLKNDFKYFLTEDPSVHSFFIIAYVDIPFYAILLRVIETLRASKNGSQVTPRILLSLF